MSFPQFSRYSPGRRGLLLGGGAAALLAACGGGDDGTPAIVEFSADRAQYFVGERARISVRFSGASARIEPDIGPVLSGTVITTEALASTRRLQLVVQTPGLPTARRDLWLPVHFRDRWQAVGRLAVAYHTAVNAGDGSVIVIGGSRGQGVLSDAIERFDPATRQLQRIGTLSSGRSDHTAVRLPDGRILVVGGATSSPGRQLAELVDEDTGDTTPAGPLVQPRHRHAATLLANGRVLISGGMGRNTAEIWEPATGVSRLITSRMAHDREFHTATEMADGRVLIAGGYSLTTNYVFAEIFDPRTETFTPLASGIAERRSLHAAHALSDRSVLLLGGEVVEGDFLPLTSVLRFDPARDSFSAQPALTTGRTLVASVPLPGDGVLMVGGQTADEVASRGGVVWRGGEQRALPALPAGRLGHTVNRLLDGRVLVLGGEDGQGRFVDDTLIYE
jgi:hypothetical protein